MWIYSANHHKKLRSLTPGLRLLLNSPCPEYCTQARPILRGYLATFGEGILLTLDLQHFESLSEAVMSQLDVEELNPETAGCSGVTLLQPDVKELNPKIASHPGVHQIEALLKYAEHLHRQFRQQITKPHLGQYLLSIIRGLQLQAGSTAQELGAFLKTLEAAGQRTKTLG